MLCSKSNINCAIYVFSEHGPVVHLPVCAVAVLEVHPLLTHSPLDIREKLSTVTV